MGLALARCSLAPDPKRGSSIIPSSNHNSNNTIIISSNSMLVPSMASLGHILEHLFRLVPAR